MIIVGLAVLFTVMNITFTLLSMNRTRRTLRRIRDYGTESIKLMPTGREKRTIECKILRKGIERIHMDWVTRVHWTDREDLDAMFNQIYKTVDLWAEGDEP